MVIFTLYEAATGLIRCSGDCPTENELPEKPEGCEFLFGVAGNPETQQVGETGALVPWTRPLEPEELSAAINLERDRRIAAGRVFDGIHVTGRDRDQLILLALKDTACDLKAAGITDAIIPFRDGQDVERMLTADEIINLADAGKAYVTAVYQASWALKAMDPIPQDIINDQYWPSID